MLKINLPADLRLERIIGFTIPRGDVFFVSDHDEVWRVEFGASPSAEPTEHAPYAFVENNNDFLGLVFDGLRENQPILRVGSTEISYDFDPKAEFVRVSYRTERQAGTIDFRTFSGDWFAASLSDDGAYLILAEPYELGLYRLD